MVEGAALEKRCAGNGTEGSNPSLSAMKNEPAFVGLFFMLNDSTLGQLREQMHTEGSVKRKHAQKLALSMLERKRTKSAVWEAPPQKHPV